jgi:hypothetical protein
MDSATSNLRVIQSKKNEMFDPEWAGTGHLQTVGNALHTTDRDTEEELDSNYLFRSSFQAWEPNIFGCPWLIIQ